LEIVAFAWSWHQEGMVIHGDPRPRHSERTQPAQGDGGNGSYLWVGIKVFSKQGARHSCVLNTYEVIVVLRQVLFAMPMHAPRPLLVSVRHMCKIYLRLVQVWHKK